MQRRTRSSQPGFMDARSKLVSRDVIFPECRKPVVKRCCVVSGANWTECNPSWGPGSSWLCPTLEVLPRSEALICGNHRSLFDGDSSGHTNETRLEICTFEDGENNCQVMQLRLDPGGSQGQTKWQFLWLQCPPMPINVGLNGRGKGFYRARWWF